MLPLIVIGFSLLMVCGISAILIGSHLEVRRRNRKPKSDEYKFTHFV